MKCFLSSVAGLVLCGSAAAAAAPQSVPDRENGAGTTDLRIAGAPSGEAMYPACELRVNGRAVPVYACRVSAVPLNQVWPGYQRPLEQTEPAGFASWDMAGPVNVEIRSKRPVRSVTVRPWTAGVVPEIDGDRVSFHLDRPRFLVVELGDAHHVLHLFPNPPEETPPAESAPGLRYFGPGIHRPGRITLRTAESVYIAPGAVVYGSIHAAGASDIRISGRGILDGSSFPRGKGGGVVRMADCRGVRIEGIIMRDPDVWCCTLLGCTNVTIENVKLIGLWRYNADGIDICNSSDVSVRNCFVRSFDDSIVLKGLKPAGSRDMHLRPVRNVRVSGCTIWCDWGRALEIGAETSAPEFSGIRFADCDIVHTTHIAMDIQHGDRARIHDVRFENIRVDMSGENLPPQFQRRRGEQYTANRGQQAKEYLPRLIVTIIRGTMYSRDSTRGVVENVAYRNIQVRAPRMPVSSLQGHDADHAVDGVRFENIRLNGRKVRTPQEARIEIGPWVRNVLFDGVAVAPAQ